MKKLTKVLCLVLALVCLFSLTSCGQSLTPEINEEEYYARSQELFDLVLGDVASALATAKEEKVNLSKRYALEAIAEAKLMESAVFIPTTSKGGNYAMSRVAPNTISTVLWGNDQYRYHQALVVSGEPITKEDRAEMKAKWSELKGSGTYESWAKEFLASKGYTLTDTYIYSFNTDPQTWDAFNTSRAADSEAIMNTYDGLMEYDIENVLRPALAESYEISEDGLTYTFHIRKGVKWVNNQGQDLGVEVKASDWVAGLQHLLDCQEGLEYLVTADGVNIKNTAEYMAGTCDFSDVGVKAIDDYTLQYTTAAPCSFFLTVLGYNIMAPLCESYYLSRGGVFGREELLAARTAGTYTYGTKESEIAYNGPYIVTNNTSENKITFEANPYYWNKDKINIKKIEWTFNDGSDPLKAYNDFKADQLSGCGLNATALVQAQNDGWFDKYGYVSATDATTYCGFMNINRTYYANFNDGAVKTTTTEKDRPRTNAAMLNVHFRRALLMALDRGAYNACSVGEALKYASLCNSYTPGTFVSLSEDVTIPINGKDTTFKAGTYYGAIAQAQIDADGIQMKIWDPEADDGIGSSTGYDGLYNPEAAMQELQQAIAELKAQGIEVSKENPIIVELPANYGSPIALDRSNALKQSVEASLQGYVQFNLPEAASALEWYYCGYYTDFGYQANYDLYDGSGWGPDYGDPQTYLDTLGTIDGYMIKTLGIN